MASATYKNILREVEQLSDDERRTLIAALTTPPDPPSIDGVTFLALLDTLPPIDAESLDEMERVINEDCERIDPDAWT